MKKVSKSFIALATMSLVPTVFGSGFEKGVMWSGKSAGIGGAYSSSVLGADSLFFNPAGLGDSQVGKKELSLNVSPTYSQFSGVLNQSNSTVDSKPTTLLPGSILYSNQLTEKWGIGAGVYISGGTFNRYPQVDFTNVSAGFTNFHPEISANLAVTEFSLGGGYKFNDNWSFGAAWRVIQTSADFSSANATAAVGSAVNVRGAKQTNYAGYRLGLKYTSDDKTWGIGASFRSQTQFQLTGNSDGQVTVAGGTSYALVGGKATLVNQLPAQLDVAGHYKFNPAHTLFLGTTFTNYSVNKELLVQGNYTTSLTGAGTLQNIAQGWRDMWNYRLGYEYAHSDDLFLRAGFVWTTPVTSEKASRATFEAPATAKTFLIGIGTGIKNNIQLDGALEYSALSGSGSHPAETTSSGTSFSAKTGDFKTKAYAAHASVKFFF